ncbi:hypothetical protein LU631_14235 [Erwinia tracheiphila]|nr:hypothetical protein [Erwinia tracheiphila]EOS93360.1 ShiA-like protein [Erwinia tracheiphila PSU-1]UIA86225.1 hypothetical protein LU631_14235 [Erwinia tracheiphila]UIA98441.1 hypothetical protein LU633_12445 [Erwinia tracheiphila]
MASIDLLAMLPAMLNHSSIMTERASLMKCSEELFNEHDFDAQGQIIDRQRRLMNGIDHQLSTKIVKEQTRSGNLAVDAQFWLVIRMILLPSSL